MNKTDKTNKIFSVEKIYNHQYTIQVNKNPDLTENFKYTTKFSVACLDSLAEAEKYVDLIKAQPHVDQLQVQPLYSIEELDLSDYAVYLDVIDYDNTLARQKCIEDIEVYLDVIEFDELNKCVN
jgi:hypothetical protein